MNYRKLKLRIIGLFLILNLGSSLIWGQTVVNLPECTDCGTTSSIWTEIDSVAIYEGKVKIGEVPELPGKYRLYVDEGIMTEELKIALQSTSDWADYVFDKEYSLMTLPQVEQYIEENGHLPKMLSAQEMVGQGLDVKTVIRLQQEKIEELTLYMIQQNKELDRLSNLNKIVEKLIHNQEEIFKRIDEVQGNDL